MKLFTFLCCLFQEKLGVAQVQKELSKSKGARKVGIQGSVTVKGLSIFQMEIFQDICERAERNLQQHPFQ